VFLTGFVSISAGFPSPGTQCTVISDDHLAVRSRKIVGSIIIMFNVIEIAKLLHLRTITTLASLRFVLNVPEDESQPVRYFILHSETSSWIPRGVLILDFSIDLKETHITLFRNCIMSFEYTCVTFEIQVFL